MSVNVSKNVGFCFGVNRAVETVYKLLDENKKVCTLGPVVHNPQVINDMKSKGVIVVESLKDIPQGYTLIIRAHGVAKSIIDELESLKIDYLDMTCPFVKKIHNILGKRNGITFIFGNANHPEVKGIIGNASGKVYVFNNSSDLLNTINKNEIPADSPISVVEQTTFNTDEWKMCLPLLKNHYTNCKIFDTICNTTQSRQLEAAKLAENSDLMVVIGGRKSSNTLKLKEICEKYCKTILVESVDEINIDLLKGAKKIGITVGASTPAYIILEVKRKMENMLNKNSELENDSNFEEMLEESLKNMDTSKRVKGTVVNITPSEVYVDIGRKHAGFIPISELSHDHNVKCEDVVKVGDVLDLLIIRTNDQDGTVMLSKKRLDSIEGFEEIANAENEHTILSGTVSEVVKGGVIVLYKGIKVFIPASLATASKKETLESLKGKTVEFRIIELSKPHKRTIGSIKSVLDDKKKQQQDELWEKIKVGDKIKGKVVSFTSYGAFVDLGGIDGMIHISELSWTKVKHPSDVLSIGQEVTVVIIDMNRETGRIALSYKQDQENPWDVLKRDYPVGSVIDATIINMTDFGAFAKIIPGIDGLIHISQISNKRIKHPKDVLSVGDIVKVKITDIDFDRHRVGLSIKALIEPEDQAHDSNAEALSEGAVSPANDSDGPDSSDVKSDEN